MWYTSTGKIVYDPYRGSMKHKTAWWCVLEVDPEITRYYRWWIEREHHIHSLVVPAWDAHVSIIRGEEPREDLKHLWKKYHGQKVEFKYEHNPSRAKKSEFWFVEVEAPFLIDIRKEFEKPYDWALHLTVGKQQY
jgi:hypothetical protein